MKNRIFQMGAIALMSLAAFGCSAVGSKTNGVSSKTGVKGIPVDKLCRMTNDPRFMKNERFPDHCDASFDFGPPRASPGGGSFTPGFQLLSGGKDGIVNHIHLVMSGRDDAAALELFAREAGNISQLINGRGLPTEIENGITKSSSSGKTKATQDGVQFEFERMSSDMLLMDIDVF